MLQQTSLAAYESVKPILARQESMIFSVLAEDGPMNAERIALRIGALYSWRPDAVAVCRCFAKMERAGLIEYAGYTAANANGRAARCMRVKA
jgi:DNA-binding PadR family transcriptional regulator